MKLKIVMVGLCALFGLILVGVGIPNPTWKEVAAFVGSCTLFGLGIACAD